MSIRPIVALLSSLAFACTPFPDEHAATPVDTLTSKAVVDPGMSVTVEEVSELSSPTIGVLAFNIGNNTSDFLHVDDVLVDFGSERKTQAQAPLEGEDLRSWMREIAARNETRRANTHLALAVLALAADGALAAHAASHSRPIPPPLLSHANALAFEADQASGAEFRVLPHQHLLSGRFAITPGLSDLYWLAIKTEDQSAGCVDFVSVRLHVRERGWLQFVSHFRGPNSQSEWLSEACQRAKDSAPKRSERLSAGGAKRW